MRTFRLSFNALFLLAMAIFVSSCEEDATLSISPNISEIVFDADGNPQKQNIFSVITNQKEWKAIAYTDINPNPWELFTPDEFCHVIFSKTNGVTVFTITVDKNKGDERIAVVQVTAGDATPKDILVKQKAIE